jgi:hypothetical protein
MVVRTLCVSAGMALAYVLTGCTGQVKMLQDFEAMEEGDLVFRSSGGVKSEAVLRLDKEDGEYTHVGMVVRPTGNIKILRRVNDREVMTASIVSRTEGRRCFSRNVGLFRAS